MRPVRGSEASLVHDLRVAVSIAYAFRWRMQSEVLTPTREQVSLGTCTLRLEPETTGNDEGRLVYLTPEQVVLLHAQDEQVRILEMRLGRRMRWLFPYLGGEHEGKRIQDFRKTWKAACLEAMLEGLEGEDRKRRKADLEANPNQELLKMLRHDFRRTAVRNMVNRGVPERVAMKIMGHKTRAVFDRYHIVSPGNLQGAARKLAGTFSGTLPEMQRRSLSKPPLLLAGPIGAARRSRPAGQDSNPRPVRAQARTVPADRARGAETLDVSPALAALDYLISGNRSLAS